MIIPNYSEYKIDELGQVYSSYTDKLLKPQDNGTGYKFLRLKNDLGKIDRIYVHRLMASAYLNLQDNRPIDHIDGDRSNNRLDNLRVCTHIENSNYIKVRNPTGYTGVSEYKGVFYFRFVLNGTRYCDYGYKTAEEADCERRRIIQDIIKCRCKRVYRRKERSDVFELGECVV